MARNSTFLLHALLWGYLALSAARMQHTTNRLQVGVYLSGYGLYAETEGDALQDGDEGERKKEVVSLHFDLSPEGVQREEEDAVDLVLLRPHPHVLCIRQRWNAVDAISVSLCTSLSCCVCT
jgi:hypothetical protein